MSTNKTPNYQLHSWIPEDEFHLTEINQNFAKLDASLKSEATAAAQKAAALESALGQRVRMVTGSYVGKGDPGSDKKPTAVTLGFKPKAVVIINTVRYASGIDLSFLAIEGNESGPVRLTTDGFVATNLGSSLNYESTPYHYAAFY